MMMNKASNPYIIKTYMNISAPYTWASSWKNVSSGISDQARHKPACAATETS